MGIYPFDASAVFEDDGKVRPIFEATKVALPKSTSGCGVLMDKHDAGACWVNTSWYGVWKLIFPIANIYSTIGSPREGSPRRWDPPGPRGAPHPGPMERPREGLLHGPPEGFLPGPGGATPAPRGRAEGEDHPGPKGGHPPWPREEPHQSPRDTPREGLIQGPRDSPFQGPGERSTRARGRHPGRDPSRTQPTCSDCS